MNGGFLANAVTCATCAAEALAHYMRPASRLRMPQPFTCLVVALFAIAGDEFPGQAWHTSLVPAPAADAVAGAALIAGTGVVVGAVTVVSVVYRRTAARSGTTPVPTRLLGSTTAAFFLTPPRPGSPRRASPTGTGLGLPCSTWTT